MRAGCGLILSVWTGPAKRNKERLPILAVYLPCTLQKKEETRGIKARKRNISSNMQNSRFRHMQIITSI
jgi:hypothetical protein